VLIFYADKLMVMGNSKNSYVFNFAILLKSRKFIKYVISDTVIVTRDIHWVRVCCDRLIFCNVKAYKNGANFLGHPVYYI